MGIKKKALWTCIALVIAILTIRAVFSSAGGGLTIGELYDTLRSADPKWLIAAVFGMFGIIYFEGRALLAPLSRVGYRRSGSRGFLYSAADVYFSAITPSASGGQPASAYFMVRDGIPVSTVTAVLILNLVMYTLAIVLLSVICMLAGPQYFLQFSTPSKVLIVAGFLALSGLAVLFILLLKKSSLVFGTARRLVRFLSKHHLMRHPERRLKKLHESEEEYRLCVQLLQGHRGMLASVFFYDLLQRLSQFFVIIAIYMATGGEAGRVGELFVTQCYIIMGSNCVPVPGGMGVTDYLMLDGYGRMFGPAYAANLEMIGRSLTFYGSVLISALTVLVGYLAPKRRTHSGDTPG